MLVVMWGKCCELHLMCLTVAGVGQCNFGQPTCCEKTGLKRMEGFHRTIINKIKYNIEIRGTWEMKLI